MSLVADLKARIIAAMKGGNTLEKDLFRVVMGDVQTQARGVEPTDEMALGVIKKMAASLKETIGLGEGAGRDMGKEKQEVILLEELLPKNWSVTEIEAWFLNHDDPLYEMIGDADNDNRALGIAMKALKAAGAPVNAEDVKAVVAKARAAE